MDTRPFRRLGAIAAFLLLFTIAACGGVPGGGDGEPDGPGSSSAAQPGGEDPGEDPGADDPDGGGTGGDDDYFSEPDPGLPSQDEFLERVEPMIAALAPPNSTEVERGSEEDLMLYVEFESTDSYDTLEAYYTQAIAAAGFEPDGGPTDFPESAEWFFYHPDAPEFEGGVTIRGNQVSLVFLGIPPTSCC